MRLYDRVIANSVLVPNSALTSAEAVARDIAIMPSAVCIDATNVADYIYAHEKQNWSFRDDFPTIAPPFDRFWIEYQIPKYSNTGHGTTDLHPWAPRIGMMMVSEPREDGGWYMCANMYGGTPSGSVANLLARIVFCVDAEGQIVPPGQDAIIRKSDDNQLYVPSILTFKELRLGDLYAYEGLPIDVATWSALLAISFMHCKNVTLEDAPFIGPRQQRRALERKGIKQTKFKMLAIEPMKHVLKTEGGIEHNGLKRALHICRGHFKTFTPDKPRFGREGDYGMFWTAAHVRGNADNGTVYKDYKVKAPKP